MTNPKYYVGIDPGSKGAMAIIDSEGNVADIIDIDNGVGTYANLCYRFGEDYDREYYVAVEDVCGRPGQSCVANTTFMKLAGYAELLGCFMSTDFLKVKPQVWKKYFGLISKGLTKTQRKHLSIELAKELFPSVALQLTASKDGRAEALLIAEYMRRVSNQ
jgi:hypothetical protein